MGLMFTDFCILGGALIRCDSQTANKSDFPFVNFWSTLRLVSLPKLDQIKS